MKPRLLDLFCGAGGAAVGYARAGFEVVGVDHRPQPNYPFTFIQADVFHAPIFWDDIDAIHASPPCQLFSAYQRANKRQGQHLNLIPETRALLEETGLPYVIENVPGAPLANPKTICGVSVGLQVRRHRQFETSMGFDLMTPPCACGWQPSIHQASSNRTSRRTVAVGQWNIPLELQQEAMGIDWMPVPELSQAIPPAYTELIGHQLLQHIQAEAVA